MTSKAARSLGCSQKKRRVCKTLKAIHLLRPSRGRDVRFRYSDRAETSIGWRMQGLDRIFSGGTADPNIPAKGACDPDRIAFGDPLYSCEGLTQNLRPSFGPQPDRVIRIRPSIF